MVRKRITRIERTSVLLYLQPAWRCTSWTAGFRVKDRVRVSKESLPGYPEAMRLGWILDVMDDDAAGPSYEVAVSLPNTEGTRLMLPADQIELVSRTG